MDPESSEILAEDLVENSETRFHVNLFIKRHG